MRTVLFRTRVTRDFRFPPNFSVFESALRLAPSHGLINKQTNNEQSNKQTKKPKKVSELRSVRSAQEKHITSLEYRLQLTRQPQAYLVQHIAIKEDECREKDALLAQMQREIRELERQQVMYNVKTIYLSLSLR